MHVILVIGLVAVALGALAGFAMVRARDFQAAAPRVSSTTDAP